MCGVPRMVEELEKPIKKLILDEDDIEQLREKGMSSKQIRGYVLEGFDYVRGLKQTTKSDRVKTECGRLELLYLDWLRKNPDEPIELSAADSLKNIMQTLIKYFGPEGLGIVMVLHDESYGTPEQKKEGNLLIKDNATKEQWIAFFNKRLDIYKKSLVV